MNEELNLVRDLALILISAGVISILFRWLKQPLVLGYIIAGIIIGPHIHFFFNISSHETVEQWSEIGIIFMMFGLGLEFSFKKLMKVGSASGIIAASKFIGLFIIGFILGQALSWSVMESIFLAGLLSMSSTAVIIKSFNDMGLKDKPYAQMSFGAIIIEDLVAVLLMVLLTSIAVSSSFSGTQLLYNLGKLAFFLILWFLVGIYLIPTLIAKAKKYINDEILLIVSIGLCFAMVAFAEAVGFSAALGAFMMGSILSETIESHRIEKLVVPIKDLFGAIFFVSVGMMIDPSIIAQNWAIILLLCILVMIGGFICVTTGVLIAGKGLENAVHSGFALAQLGEFGFIIAAVGVDLGVVREFIYPVIISVSVITTFLAPFAIKLSTKFYLWLRKVLPQKWQEKIDSLEKDTNSTTKAEQSEWKILLKSYIIRVSFYSVLVIAVDLCITKFVEPFVINLFPTWNSGHIDAVILALTLVVIAPFIYGLGVNSGAISKSASKLLKEKRSNRWYILGLILLRTIISAGLILAVVSKHIHLAAWSVLLLILAIGVIILLSRRYLRKFTSMEQKFLNNYNQKEKLQRESNPISSLMKEKLAGYNIHIEALTVPPEFLYIGTKLRNLSLRADTGANIVKIIRGENTIVIPSGDVQLYPNDTILAVGTDEQISKLKDYFENSRLITNIESDEFKVECIEIEPDSYLVGKTLRSSNFSDFRCMVVSVLRGGEIITNPKPDFSFEVGDSVWIAGEVDSCKWLRG